jgi:phage gpG-like protein
MSDIIVRIEGLDQALMRLDNFKQVIARTLESPQVLREIGTVLAASGEKTITEGGRPIQYKPLAASTIAARAKKGKGSSKPLIYLGTLRNSLDYEVDGNTLYLTSVEYLKYHQFEENRVKAKFPARPVWGAQKEDVEDISDILLENLKENL